MRVIGILLAACMVLAAAQAAMAVLCVVLLCGLIYGLFTAPKEMLGFLGLLFVAGIFQAQPLAFLGVIALMTIANVLRRY